MMMQITRTKTEMETGMETKIKIRIKLDAATPNINIADRETIIEIGNVMMMFIECSLFLLFTTKTKSKVK